MMRYLIALRRRLERVGPYGALVVLAVPLAIVEPFKLVAVLVAGSAQDPGTVPAGKKLLSVLHTPGPNQLLTVQFGGHTTSVWRSMLPAALLWLSARLT